MTPSLGCPAAVPDAEQEKQAAETPPPTDSPGDQPSSQPDPTLVSTAVPASAAAEWLDVEPRVVELAGEQYLAVRPPLVSPGTVQLRLVQKQLPEGVSGWSDWARNARKDSEAWLSRACPPAVVRLEAPGAPIARVEVPEDGASLAALLRWSVPASSRSGLGRYLRWQYRWQRQQSHGQHASLGPVDPHRATSSSDEVLRSDPAEQQSEEAEAAEVASEERRHEEGPPANPAVAEDAACADRWLLGAEFECREFDAPCKSPRLYGSWNGSTVFFSVRYRGERSAVWSPWSVPSKPVDVFLQPPRPRGGSALQVEPQLADPSSATLSWEAFLAANQRVHSLQYRVDLEPVGTGVASASSPLAGGGTVAGDAWSDASCTVCVMEQRVQGGPARLSCVLRQLLPKVRYRVWVRARHWRIDPGWRAALSLDYVAPALTEEEPLPLLPLPDACLPGPIEACVAAAGGGGLMTEGVWCGFWMPPPAADWPPSSVSLEWAHDDDEAEGLLWHLARCS